IGMKAIDLLLKQLDHTYDQEGWYLPLQPALSGLTAAQANWRPSGEAANTIWETVNHLLYYKERLLERLQGNTPDYPATSNDDTFAGAGSSDDEEAWQATVARVEAVQKGLVEALSAKTDDELDTPYSETPLGVLMADIFLHDACHTG
ncbi:DinB family protein, partial [Frankia sp. Cpl3]|nr:DinB family protein [Frankia sp. Cpl3]